VTYQCRVVINGDPKADLIYHLDSQRFEYDGEPDLSVVHVRCEARLRDAMPMSYRGELNLNDTDLEVPLNLQFFITDMQSTDYLWANTGPAKLTEAENAREEFKDDPKYGRSGSDMQPNGPNGDHTRMVGKLSFLTSRAEPRKFSWALHKTPETKSKQVSGDVSREGT